MKRSESLDRVRQADAPFDIAIIGGGASGLGAALDAVARGHRVALFEQADFAKGTSSRSTKLVHGGVRYLQQGNIALVMDALRERGRLTRNAPHLVRSQAFVIPTYSWWQGPFYGIGMKVYDQLAGKLGLAQSRFLDREETLAQIPTVEREGLSGGVIYHDGQFDDARLAINIAQSAEMRGAAVLNYCRCVGLVKESGRICGVEIHDQETGEQFAVRAKVVINATGVFVDDLRQMDDPAARGMVAVSQGIHLVLPKRFLPGDAAIMVPKTADGRVLFAVPWHDCVVVGTTDTPIDQRSLEPRALEEECDFVMSHARQYLDQDPRDSDVLSVFAGLRPLVRSGQGSDTAALSRDHSIVRSQSGLITLTGGKWTTYRKMGQDVIDQAEIAADLNRVACPTEHLLIYGAAEATRDTDTFEIYGSDAGAIATLAASESQLNDQIHPKLNTQKAEIVWHARHEMARTVEDSLARRCRALLLDAAASIEAAPTVAALLAGELGRDELWQRKQVDAYTRLAEGYVYSNKASRAAAPERL